MQYQKSHERSSFLKQISRQIVQQQTEKCICLAKIRCAFHPNQFITNFCICQCCLLPLCPSCIKIHTIQHANIKKVLPQYQPITDLLSQIYNDIDEMLIISNQNYKKITQIDARVGTFRNIIQQKIKSVKENIIAQIQKHFNKIYEDIENKINNMNYIKILKQYKQQMKKTIIGLKNIQKCFNPDNDKIMRVIIKYKSITIKKQIQGFNHNLGEFIKMANNNFITFSVRQDYKYMINGYLDNIKKIQICDVRALQPINNICTLLKQIYEKNGNQCKKQNNKQINNFFNGNSNKQNQQIQQKDSFTNKSLKTVSRIGTPGMEGKRRSISKGRGLSVLQIDNSFSSWGSQQVKNFKAINICPLQLNSSHFFGKDQ